MISSGMMKTEIEELTAEITPLDVIDGNEWIIGDFE